MARIFIGNIKGPKGDTGARGATGPQGATGATGPMPPLTNNALATTPGVSALDAVMGKTLDEKIGGVISDLGALATNLTISNYTYYPVTSSTASNTATIKGTGKVISIDGALTAKAGLSIEKWGKTLVGWVPEGTVPTNDVYCYMQDNMYILIDTQRQVWLCNRTAATKDVSNVSYLYSCTYLIQ